MSLWDVGWWEDGPHDSTTDPDGRLVNSYHREYLVRYSGYDRPTEAQIATALGIKRGSSYPNDEFATCHHVQINPGPVKTRPPYLAWLVHVDWATNAPMPAEDSTDPTTTRVQWSIRPYNQTVYINEDRNKKAILDAAQKPFNGGVGVEARFGSLVATRRRSLTGYDRGTSMRYSGRLNSKSFLGAKPYTLQVDITSGEKYEGKYVFVEEEFVFSWTPLSSWQPRPVNAGFWLRTMSDKWTPITVGMLTGNLADDTKVQEPEPLTEDGTEIVAFADRPNKVNFIEVDYFDSYDFNKFNLL